MQAAHYHLGWPTHGGQSRTARLIFSGLSPPLFLLFLLFSFVDLGIHR